MELVKTDTQRIMKHYVALFGPLGKDDKIEIYLDWWAKCDEEKLIESMNRLEERRKERGKPRLGELKRAFAGELQRTIGQEKYSPEMRAKAIRQQIDWETAKRRKDQEGNANYQPPEPDPELDAEIERIKREYPPGSFNDGRNCTLCGGKGYGYTVTGIDDNDQAHWLCSHHDTNYPAYAIRKHPCRGAGRNHFESTTEIFGEPDTFDGKRHIAGMLKSGGHAWFKNLSDAQQFIQHAKSGH